MIKIRKFNLKDVDFIVDNWLGTDRLDGVFQEDTVEKVQNRILSWERELGKNGGTYLGFAVLLNESLIGVAWFSENVKDELTFSLYLDVDYRGKGYSKVIFKLLEEEIRRRGFKILKSSCRQDNIASEKMHRKLGFELIKSELSPNGTPMFRWKKYLN